jgi:hypothetical protein
MRLALLLAVVVASGAAAEPQLNGFVTYGRGELRGSVTNRDGKPIAGAKVHVISKAGALLATTGADGTYRITLDGSDHAFVYIDEAGKVTGQVATPTGSNDVIEIHEVLPPAIAAKPKGHLDRILEYSDAAADADTWARAWLLLDVSDTGAVTQVKLLNDPGHDLAPIAVKDAFTLTFEPARDRSKHRVRSAVLWTYEWPAYWWMIDNHYPMTRLPVETVTLPCNGRDSTFVRHRDCSTPDLAKIVTQPWLTPVTSK